MKIDQKQPSPDDRESEWIDILLGEIRSPQEKSDIPNDHDTDPESLHRHARLVQVVESLRYFYPNKRNPMIDLTLEQKKEIYATFTDRFAGQGTPVVRWYQAFRIAMTSAGAAVLLLAAVPLVQWISTPQRPTSPIQALDDAVTAPAPVVIETVPPEPETKDQEETPEEIPFRPSFDDLTYPPANTGVSPFGIPALPGWDPSGLNIGDEIRNMMDVDVIPSPVHQVAPAYPADQRQARTSGSVILEFVVDERGSVMQPKVLQSSHPSFNQPAIDALRKWKFEPGLKDGKPVKVRMRVPMVFNAKS
jgi:periplasmic protein TonB